MHLALYRKWRSATFDDVCGQEHVTSVLKYETASGMISHAYLFSGPRGTGKTSCAKILSRAVNCLNPQNGNPCNECEACRSILSGSAVDVIEMDAASNNGVDNIRDIRDEVMFTPAELKYRVYIVDEVHMLSASAFNALLKTLEEPPAHVIFILATTELHKLPETVISRCQRFDFKRLTVPVISSRLEYIADQEPIPADKSALDEIARLSNGGMRDAISLFELCAGRHTHIDESLVTDVLGTLGYESVARAAAAVSRRDYDAIFSIIADLCAAGRDISVFLNELTSFYRDMLIYKTVKSPDKFLDISSSSMKLLAETAEGFTVPDILYHSRLLDEAAQSAARQTGSQRLSAELALVKMCDPSLDLSPDSMLARISALEDTVKLLSVGGIVKTAPEKSDDRSEPTKTIRSREKKGDDPENPDVNDAPAKTEPSEKQPLPYWSELLSRLQQRNAFLGGFLQFLSGYKEGDKFIIECSNPFTYEVCSGNKQLFTELLTVFDGSVVTDEKVVIRDTSKVSRRDKISLDDIG